MGEEEYKSLVNQLDKGKIELVISEKDEEKDEEYNEINIDDI
jgi:hypothetical protein